MCIYNIHVPEHKQCSWQRQGRRSYDTPEQRQRQSAACQTRHRAIERYNHCIRMASGPVYVQQCLGSSDKKSCLQEQQCRCRDPDPVEHA